MAKSLYTGDSRRSMKEHAERPTFNQTCKLLSRVMKEKRFAIDSSKGSPPAVLEDKVMNCLPRFIQNSRNENESDSRGKDQLTIFYCGKVLVLNDFPAKNATEVMEMATKLSSKASAMEKAQTSTAPVPPETKKMAIPAINISEQQCPTSESEASDVKITGKASLQKFIEKRKERITARWPYPLINYNLITSASICKPNDEPSSGASDDVRDHGQSSKELDLTL